MSYQKIVEAVCILCTGKI